MVQNIIILNVYCINRFLNTSDISYEPFWISKVFYSGSCWIFGQPVTPLFVVYSVWARNTVDQLAVFAGRGWRASYSLHARGRVEPGEVVKLLCPPVQISRMNIQVLCSHTEQRPVAAEFLKVPHCLSNDHEDLACLSYNDINRRQREHIVS